MFTQSNVSPSVVPDRSPLSLVDEIKEGYKHFQGHLVVDEENGDDLIRTSMLIEPEDAEFLRIAAFYYDVSKSHIIRTTLKHLRQQMLQELRTRQAQDPGTPLNKLDKLLLAS